jgi:hypothetical protein
MNYYHIWCNLKESHRDLEFCDHLSRYLGHLKSQDLIAGFKLTRRKLGFGPDQLGEFHIIIDCRDLVQLEQAFGVVAVRSGNVESLHRPVYEMVTDFISALYRDFPDPERVR